MPENPLRAKRILLLGREYFERDENQVKLEDWLDEYIFRFQAVAITDYLRWEESLYERISKWSPDATIFHVMSPRDSDSVLSLPKAERGKMVVRIRSNDLDFVKELKKAHIQMFESTGENDLVTRLYSCLVIAVTSNFE